MASGWTNRGLKCVLNAYCRADGSDEPAGFKLILIVTGNTPDSDTTVVSGLTELANGNGYTTGGATVARSSSGFEAVGEDQTNNRATIELQDVTWNITGAGVSGIQYAILVDDAATPNVIAYFDLNGPKEQVAGQPFTVKDATLRLSWSA